LSSEARTKSKVKYIGEDRIRKTCISSSGRGWQDPVLSASSTCKPAKYYFRKQVKFLGALNEIPDGERLPPKLYSTDDNDLSFEMERIVGKTLREEYIEALASPDQNIIDVSKDVPRQVAAIHYQLNWQKDDMGRTYQRKLLDEVRWGNTIGLKTRSNIYEREKVWHYLRTIIYLMSPDKRVAKIRDRARKFRLKKNRPQTKPLKIINRDLIVYLDNKGIDSVESTTRFVNRHNLILYDTDDPGKKVDCLLKKRDLMIVTSDLGPHHFVDGRFFDLDEARLGAGVIDLVSALYNIYTYKFSPGQEIDLMELSFGYLEEMLGKEPSKEERMKFVAKVNEQRLYEGLRLFAADCKASIPELRRFTRGIPKYDKLSDRVLRQEFLQDFFVDGLQPWIEFWSRHSGWSILSDYSEKHLSGQQFREVEGHLMDTGVFEGISDPEIIEGLEDILSNNKR